MVIREILEQRRKAYRLKRISKIIVMLSVISLILCCAFVQGIKAFFISARSEQVTLRVTDTLHPIKALLFFDNPSRFPMTTTPDAIQPILLTTPDVIDLYCFSDGPITGRIKLEKGYDVNDVDLSTIQAFQGNISLSIDKISIEKNELILSLDRGYIESTLGLGTHDIEVNGLFKNGWFYFSGHRDLKIR